jgi:hypothetical protein
VQADDAYKPMKARENAVKDELKELKKVVDAAKVEKGACEANMHEASEQLEDMNKRIAAETEKLQVNQRSFKLMKESRWIFCKPKLTIKRRSELSTSLGVKRLNQLTSAYFGTAKLVGENRRIP